MYMCFLILLHTPNVQKHCFSQENSHVELSADVCKITVTLCPLSSLKYCKIGLQYN